ncbi:hypothetical protein C361_01649 [Cryptococcus neoformans Tu259-1]|uniref:DUF1765-domain-containing protein n=1 Tax=Cryptococcus neoformans Tu259-1 TaxID=1230072 RepID=A0A854QLY1_CRYNE|nr:hypothetical protein C361_01649 [Cryptococcus neoformans var. grubii Tu259-1]
MSYQPTIAQPSTLPKTGKVSSRRKGSSNPPVMLRSYADPRTSQDALERPQMARPYAQNLNSLYPNRTAPTPPSLHQVGYPHPAVPFSAIPSPTIPTGAISPTAPLNIRPRMSSAPVVSTTTQGTLLPVSMDPSLTSLDNLPPGSDRIEPRVSSRPRAPGAKAPVVLGKDSRAQPLLEERPIEKIGPKRRPSLEASTILDGRGYSKYHAARQKEHSLPKGFAEDRPTTSSREPNALQGPIMVPLKVDAASDRPPMNGRGMSAPVNDVLSSSSPPRNRQRELEFREPHAESSSAAQKKWKKSQQESLGVGGPSRSFDIARSFDFERKASGGGRSLDVQRSSDFDAALLGDEGERKSSGGKSMKKKSSDALRALFGRGASGKGKKEDAPTTSVAGASQERKISPSQLMVQNYDDNSQRSRSSGRATPTMGLNSGRTTPTFDSRSSNEKSTPTFDSRPGNGRTTPTLKLSSSSSSSSRLNAPSRELPPPPEPSPTFLTAIPPTLPPLPSPVESSKPPTFDPSTSTLLSLSIDDAPFFPSNSPRRLPFAKPATPPRLPSPHRLQLPELDLDFHLEFDSFNFSPTSASRRTSPLKVRTPKSPSPKSSPVRSYSTRSPSRPSNSPERLQRSWTVLERTTSDGLSMTEGDEGAPPLRSSARFSRESRSPKLSSMEKNEVFGPLLEDQSSKTSSLALTRSPSPRETISSQLPSSEDSTSTESSTHESASPILPVTPKETTPTTSAFGEVSLSTSSSTVDPPSSASLPNVNSDVQCKEEKKLITPNPPPIALSTVPPPAAAGALAPPAIISSPAPVIAKMEQPVRKEYRKHELTLLSKSETIIPDKNFSISAIAHRAEEIRVAFKYPEGGTSAADRAVSLRADLVPLIAEADRRTYSRGQEGEYTLLREAFLKWINVLISELKYDRPVDERGAVLESLAALFESIALSEDALQLSEDHRDKFTQMMIRCMSFVMEKLGGRGVFQNILVFSGRFLAFAFFRVPHVAHQLLTVLQLPKGALMRFTGNITLAVDCPSSVQPQYPKHLIPLCFDNVVRYTSRLNSFTAEFETEAEREAFLFTPGYWLRRWQSDDSELFPSFYRAYHRQLARYLGPVIKYYEAQNKPVPAAILMRAPGYAHLATAFAKKLYSYIMGTVNAVTTYSTASNFDATESALQAPNAKPPVLVTANRRLTETLITFSEQRITIPVGKEVIDCEMSQIYIGMIDLWTKNLISKTSLNAPKGVFCLFDLLDGIVDPPYGAIPGIPSRLDSVVDVAYLIHVVRIILTQTEHAMTIVKTIAFVFSHWEVMTARTEDRRELCLDLLLDKEVFERLLLFWSHSVRSYMLRLVVFRLGHLETSGERKHDAGWQAEIQTVRLLQTRLDCIKRRYDELEPKPIGVEAAEDENGHMPVSPLDAEEPFMPRSRSTITMVTDARSAVSVDKAERLLGLGLGAVNASRGELEIDPVTGSNKFGKAAKWLKKNFKNKKKGKWMAGSTLGSLDGSPTMSSDADSPGLEASPEIFGGPRSSKELGSSPLIPPRTPPKNSDDWSESSTSITTTSTSNPTASITPPSQCKPKPPTIITTPSERGRPRGNFTFEFEIPTMSPRSDTFDATPTSPRHNSQPPPSPRKPTSPHMSKSFSKRSSLLPPSTANALDSIMESEREKEKEKKKAEEKVRQEKGYDKRLHPYAIRMLGELEDAQKEYDEWWSDGGYGKLDGLPPRLTVAWPFHDNED